MWLVGLVIMILQLPFFLGASSIERVVICWGAILNENLVKTSQPVSWIEKENWETNKNILAL